MPTIEQSSSRPIPQQHLNTNSSPQAKSGMTTEAILSLVFGLVMFILAALTLWHMYRRKKLTNIGILPIHTTSASSGASTPVAKGQEHDSCNLPLDIRLDVKSAWQFWDQHAKSQHFSLTYVERWSAMRVEGRF